MQNLLPQHRRDENDGGRSSAAVMPDRETTRPMSEACEGALCNRAMRERKLASAGSPMPAVGMPAHAKSRASERCDPTVELDGGRADIPCLCALGLPCRYRPNELPHWDPDARVLTFRREVVKQFRAPAPNQEAIISAFAEEGWAIGIDDPIPPKPGCTPKHRLHSTIEALNQNQVHKLIKFSGDGTGERVCWAPVDEELSGQDGKPPRPRTRKPKSTRRKRPSH